MKEFVLPAVFTAVDKFSGPVNKMAKSSEASIARLDRKLRNISQGAFALAKRSAMVGAAIVLPMMLLANEAVKFEDKMADVAKVANVSVGSDAFNELGDKAKELGIFLGVGAIEAAGLLQNLAQGGVAIEDLDEIGKLAGKVGVAFGISADEAGEAFIKTRNALGGTIEETANLMDAINMLGNTTAASSSQIVTFMSNGGSAVARAMGASGESVAGVAAQLISMGTSAEESATIMERFAKTVLQQKDMRAVFDAASGGSEGMMAVIQKGANMSGKAQDEYFKKFGAYGLKLQLLAKNYEQLDATVQAATDSTLTSNSVNDEFANRTSTTAFKLAQAKAQVMTLAIEIGSLLIPMIVQLVSTIAPVIKRFSDWASKNKDTMAIIMKVAVAAGALAFAVSGVSFAVGIVSKAMTIGLGIMKAWKYAVMIAKAVQWAWNAAMMANPMGLMLVAVLALAAGVYALNKAYNKQTTAAKLQGEVMDRALENTIDQRVEIMLLFKALRSAAVGSEEYNKTLEKLEQIQPGIIQQYNLQKGAIEDINRAEKDLISTIMERAKVEAAAELMKEKLKTAMEKQEQGPSFWDKTWAMTKQSSLGIFNLGGLGGMTDTAEESNQKQYEQLYKEADMLGQFLAYQQMKPQGQTDLINPEQAKNESITKSIEEKNQNVTVDFKNLPPGVQVTGTNGVNFAMPGMSSTTGN